MPQQGSTWVVESGENVFKIAEQVYGNQRMAYEILKMNGGSTLIHPGDVLSLPEWNDPNVYVGANQVQNVINQNLKYADEWGYKGPEVAAVPDSQRDAWNAAQGVSGVGKNTPNVSGPNVFGQSANAELNKMLGPQVFKTPGATNYKPIIYPGGVPNARRIAGAAQGSTAVQAPNIPNRSLTQMRGPQPFATPGMSKPVENTEVARAQRYQASGVPGSALATQPVTPVVRNPLTLGRGYALASMRNRTPATAPVSPTGSVENVTPVAKGSLRGNEWYNAKDIYMRNGRWTPQIQVQMQITQGQPVSTKLALEALGMEGLTKLAELGYIYNASLNAYVPENQNFDPLARVMFERDNPPPANQIGYPGSGGGGGGYTGGGGGSGSGSVVGYSLSTRLATG
jgi:hypothetical protein